MRLFFLLLITHNLLFITCNISQAASFSSKAKGTSTAQFLRLGAGARALALGEAYSALANDALATYWNPAGLTSSPDQSLSLTHSLYIEDISYDYLGFSHKLKPSHFLGLGVQYVSWGSITQTDINGVELPSFTPKDTAFLASYGYKFKEYGSFGLTAKFIESKIVAQKETWALDAGFLSPSWSLWDKNIWGAFVLQNVGGKMAFDQKSDPLPMVAKLGFGLKPAPLWTGSLELVFPKDNTPELAFGLEKEFAPHVEWTIFPRLGFNTRTLGNVPSSLGLSLGFGLLKAPFALDYAFLPYGDLGNTHRFSLSVYFSKLKPLTPVGHKMRARFLNAERLLKQGKLLEARREYLQLESYGRLNPHLKETKKALENIDNKIKMIKILEPKETAKLTEKLLLSGIDHFNQGNNLEAKRDFEDVLRLEANNDQALLYLQKIGSAQQEFLQRKIDALIAEGQAVFDQGAFLEAMETWAKALGLAPSNLEIITKIELAKKRLEEKETKTAKTEEEQETLKKALSQAERLYQENKDKEALEALTRVQAIAPTHPQALDLKPKVTARLSETKYKEGLNKYTDQEIDSAIDDILEASSLGHLNALKLLIQIEEELSIKALRLYGSGNLEEAVFLWEKVLRINPNSEKVKTNLDTARKELELKKR